MFFMIFFLFRDKSSILFLFNNELLHIRTNLWRSFDYFKQVFLLFIISTISLSYKAKINFALLFRLKNPENQYTSHKKYDVYLPY